MSLGNPLEGDVTRYYQPDTAQSVRWPQLCEFPVAEEAKAYIAELVDVPAKPNRLAFRGGGCLDVRAEVLGDGTFTNVYDFSVWSGAVTVRTMVETELQNVGDFIKNSPRSLAAISGGFLYLADVGSGVPRQRALNLAITSGGKILSMPVVDREAVVTSHQGTLTANMIRASGELTIDNQTLSWAGSRTEHDAQSRIFGNGNVVIRHHASPDPQSRKDRIRVLDEQSRYTPPIETDSGQVDVGLLATELGEMRPVALNPRGQTDIFAYDNVLRCEQARIPNGLDSRILVRSIGHLAIGPNQIEGAFSVGPLLAEQSFATHAINRDPSLGSDPPFSDVRMVRSMVYVSDDNRIHLRVYDGRPESQVFKGVTPTEAVAIAQQETGIVWGAFLDPGRTAKIATRARHITSYGNTHYLRWPAGENQPYMWVPGAGRPMPSAIVLTPKRRLGSV